MLIGAIIRIVIRLLRGNNNQNQTPGQRQGRRSRRWR
jgi:hypothetical protein